MRFFRKIGNFFLCLRYPFWRSRDVFTGEPSGYDFTWYDDIPEGWKKAFGKDLSREIREAGRKFLRVHPDKTWADILQFRQIKEKYGSLRLYATAIDEIQFVLDKYELLSMGYCVRCGKPARCKTRGWVEYYCEDCAREVTNSPIGDIRLARGDIPALISYGLEATKTEECESEAEADALLKLEGRAGGALLRRKRFSGELNKWVVEECAQTEREVDLKERYGIDFESLWGLTGE